MSTTKWIIDPTHSEVSFKVKHLVISTVTGYFRKFEGAAEVASEDFNGATVAFTSDIDSIDTNQADRDSHLKSADFFDAENHPSLTFTSTSVKKISDDTLEIAGNMQIKGHTQAVVLKADYAGIAVDPYGQTKAGMTLSGSIKRSEFGLTWSAVTEAGHVVLSDDIKLAAELQFVKQ